MELPIDHFRLLGVSPAASAEEVLRFFQLRLDRVPHKAFTPEVIAQRSELLRRSADLLSNEESRQSYEAALLKGASGLELSSNREVAGLILLWEADQATEAFKLARKALQPPQAPALGSGREADLTLLVALSCRDAALEEQEERHYYAASELLQEGIKLLQRIGKLPEQRQILEKDLETLLPYRILDLLSRDLADQKSHQEGVNLLDSFVLKRGGIEGRNSSISSIGLVQSEFELFFQQIRSFLTVQEQVDLFTNWYRRGSSDAGFLGSIALVASGFCRRKPEVLLKARKQLSSLNLQDFDAMPLLGCIDLLLADLKQAEIRFKTSSDKGLKDWLDQYPGEQLGAFCDYCTNWLSKDVLPGFRDIDGFSVDLEAWFADRDVQDFIEKNDKKSGALGIAKAGFSFISGFSSEKTLSNDSITLKEDEQQNFPLGQENKELFKEENTYDIKETLKPNFLWKYFKSLVSIKFHHFNFNNYKPNLFHISWFKKWQFILLSLFLAGGLIGWFSIRNKNLAKEEDLSNPTLLEKALDTSSPPLDTSIDDVSEEKSQEKVLFQPLKDERPSEEQILSLLNAWLEGKSQMLQGNENENLTLVARYPLVKIVEDQRDEDKALGQKQLINAVINNIELIEQTKKRIAVNADITYQDKRIDDSGKTISETIIPSLKVKYVLGRQKKTWQLLDFISGI